MRREHRHRRAGDDPRRRQEPRRRGRRRRRRPTTARVLAELDAHDGGSTTLPLRRRARRRRPSRAPPPTTPRSRTGSPARSARPRRTTARFGGSARRDAALRREPAPVRPAFYRTGRAAAAASPTARQLQGKQLSYNNINDTDAAYRVRRRVRSRAHGRGGDRQARQSRAASPRAPRSLEAYERALRCDPASAFGGIVALNRPLDAAAATQDRRDLHRGDHRAGRDRGGRSRSSARRRTCGCCSPAACPIRARPGSTLRTVAGGFLVQARDNARRRRHGARGRDQARADRARSWPTCDSRSGSPSTSSRTPSCTRKDGATVGIGAGQMSRVDSLAHRRLEGGGGGQGGGPRREPRQGLGGGLGRVLPVRRRAARGRRGRRHRRHPAGRLGARRRGHHGGRRQRASPWCSPATATSGTDRGLLSAGSSAGFRECRLHISMSKPSDRAYFGIVTGEAILGTNFFRDFFASIRDMVGKCRSGSYEGCCAPGDVAALQGHGTRGVAIRRQCGHRRRLSDYSARAAPVSA